ncbi:hypothetical protein AVEN_201854-1 [Araneus ventricosus]|uniref:Uncharacterized protein n=1 Tax=Araneus ventricosus TaxID=182803 RepID=A0A4Y2KLY5_ARAVE|nr:hypothetical protein AVEN_201854-1 [Araneus ventricosus]
MMFLPILTSRENYQCKCGEEIQSVHFGGSRKQVTLRTVVMYYRNKSENSVEHKSIYTMSESKRHDTVTICAHLMPVFAKIKTIVPVLRNIHFLSDGPSTQYKNKNMFYLAATMVAKELAVDSLHCNYSEKGHGKGAPEGIGGCIKRLADNIVSQGRDIPNINAFVSALKETSNIEIYKINLEDIDNVEKLLPKDLETFKTHKITWSNENRTVIQARCLSCMKCKAGATCVHYGIEKIKITFPNYIAGLKPLKLHEVYSEEELSDNEQSEKVENSSTCSEDATDSKLFEQLTRNTSSLKDTKKVLKRIHDAIEECCQISF